MNEDIKWLKQFMPKVDLLNTKTKVDLIHNIIKDFSDKSERPYTIGLFGGWGSGKTTLLSYLANGLPSDYKIIYFNAWKYSHIDEIFPVLVYKILTENLNYSNQEDSNKIFKILLTLCKKHRHDLVNWLKAIVGVEAFNVYDDVNDLHNSIDNVEILEAYYAQTDQAQDLLSQLFDHQSSIKPIIVLVDELDRCDPDEALTVIKRINIFFAMTKLPIIFILSINPDPIGFVLKRQYGLNSDTAVYEANLIMERYLDTYIDMSTNICLSNFIKNIWTNKYDWTNITCLHYLETLCAKPDLTDDFVRNANILDAVTCQNPYYSNLRTLTKSFYKIHQMANLHSRQYWTIWHLEILQQTHKHLRSQIAEIATDLKDILEDSYLQLINNFYDKWDGTITDVIEFQQHNGNTPFAVYRSIFWVEAKKKHAEIINNLSQDFQLRAAILDQFLADYHIMDFLIIMLALNFKLDENDKHGTIKSFYAIKNQIANILAG